MPDFDGTGPRGKGSFTGRGLGVCVNGFGKVFKNTSRGVKLLSLIITSVTAIVLDVRKPDGITRRLARSSCDRLDGGNRTRMSTGDQIKSIEEKSL